MDPIACFIERALEIFQRSGPGYCVIARHQGSVAVHGQPFETIGVDLAAPWSY